jgi:hypothetical protein
MFIRYAAQNGQHANFYSLNMSKMIKIEKKCCRIKSYLLVLMLFVSAASISFAQNNDIKYEIIEKSTDYVKFKLSCDNQEREVIIVFREANIAPVPPDFKLEYEPITDYSKISQMNQTGDKNLVIYNNALSSEQFIVSNLVHNTDYAIDLYFYNVKDSVIQETSYKIATLAEEPSEQTKNVMVSVPQDGNLVVRFNIGNGEHRYLLVGEGQKPNMPEDGNMYETDSDLSKAYKINDHTYYINSDDKYKFVVKNLKSNTEYFFTVIEANGSGDNINYLLTENNNTASRITPPEPPINLMVKQEDNNKYVIVNAVWEKPEGAIDYILDVATDSDFQNLLSKYDNVSTGDLDKFVLVYLEKGKEYYLRMKSVSRRGNSSYTDPIRIIVK